MSGPVLEINHIPPVIRVRTLINGRLPPAVFLAVTRQEQQRQVIEEFVHMDILPVDLQVTIRREVRFVVYQRLGEDLAEMRRHHAKGYEGEAYIITQMESVWPTLSIEQQHKLIDSGITHKPKAEFHGEF